MTLYKTLPEPSWTNPVARDIYKKLFYYDIKRPLTPEEENFCNAMYHLEEGACGLDGDPPFMTYDETREFADEMNIMQAENDWY